MKLHGKPTQVLKETVLQRVSETPTTSTYIKTHHNVLTTHFTSFIENYSKRLALTKGTAYFTHNISTMCCYCCKLVLGGEMMTHEARTLEQQQEVRNNLIMVTCRPSVRTTAEDWLQALHRLPLLTQASRTHQQQSYLTTCRCLITFYGLFNDAVGSTYCIYNVEWYDRHRTMN